MSDGTIVMVVVRHAWPNVGKK